MSKRYEVTLIEVVKTKYIVEVESPLEAIDKAGDGDYDVAEGITIVDHLNSLHGEARAKEIKV